MKINRHNTYSIGWSICSWCTSAMERVWLKTLFETHGICSCCKRKYWGL